MLVLRSDQYPYDVRDKHHTRVTHKVESDDAGLLRHDARAGDTANETAGHRARASPFGLRRLLFGINVRAAATSLLCRGTFTISIYFGFLG